MAQKKYEQGTFGYDLEFLQKHTDPIVLSDPAEQSILIVSPRWQGRVMTSTARGMRGTSFGWINYELISSGEQLEHFHPFGGEDRLWLGPEGGQFSLYFKKGSSFTFENWYVPAAFDTEAFDLLEQGAGFARFRREVVLENYSGFTYRMKIERDVHLLDREQAEKILDVEVGPDLAMVAYRGDNRITNTGDQEWNEQTGMPSIWILDMFSPSPGVTIFIPFRTGTEEELGQVVTDDYFGKVPADRLIVDAGLIYFKADGKYRSKIGIGPRRALPVAGSYDALSKTLTLIRFTLHPGNHQYVNSLWELQDEPFAGDAVNSYNDGPLEDGSQMGPFYELESSSPAAALAPGESLLHQHSVFHFQGGDKELSLITQKLFGIGIKKIKSIFKD